MAASIFLNPSHLVQAFMQGVDSVYPESERSGPPAWLLEEYLSSLRTWAPKSASTYEESLDVFVTDDQRRYRLEMGSALPPETPKGFYANLRSKPKGTFDFLEIDTPEVANLKNHPAIHFPGVYYWSRVGEESPCLLRIPCKDDLTVLIDLEPGSITTSIELLQRLQQVRLMETELVCGVMDACILPVISRKMQTQEHLLLGVPVGKRSGEKFTHVDELIELEMSTLGLGLGMLDQGPLGRVKEGIQVTESFGLYVLQPTPKNLSKPNDKNEEWRGVCTFAGWITEDAWVKK